MLHNSVILSKFSKFGFTFSSLCIRRCIRTSSPSCRNVPRKTHYEILGLKQNAGNAEIRAEFVKLSKEIHPDRNPDDPDNHTKFIMLNEAYTILNKPLSRREYDLSLAHLLHVQQSMARAGFTAHTAGDEPTPGFSPRPESYRGNDNERIFWDETIWYMRDRSKDSSAFYDQSSYYGIKGIRRQSNSVVVSICLVLIACGFFYFYAAFKYTTRKQRLHRENVDRKNSLILTEARERAKRNGTTRQLEIFHANRLNHRSTSPPIN